MLNQETVQDSNTSQLVHKVEAVVAWISRYVTLMLGHMLQFLIECVFKWTSKILLRLDFNFISFRFFTLLPGDVILTGTPPGVGVFRKPPVFLKASLLQIHIFSFATNLDYVFHQVKICLFPFRWVM